MNEQNRPKDGCHDTKSQEALIGLHKRHCEVDFGEWYVRLMGLTKEDTVLDLGCGAGFPAVEMAKPAGLVVGVDIQEDLLHAAMDRYLAARAARPHRWAGFVWLCGSIEDDECVKDIEELGPFDVVTINFAMMYFNRDRLHALLKRVKRPLGRIYIAGYGSSNAIELIRLQRDAIGFVPDADAAGHSDVNQYVDEMQWYGVTAMHSLNSRMRFDDADELVSYYEKTIMCEQSCMRDPIAKDRFREAAEDLAYPFDITKRVKVLEVLPREGEKWT